jgi:predicted O-linked N-acetylglucosamine transferase (SPINDLY family)
MKPHLAEAWLGRGNVFFYDLKRYDEAFAAYDRAVSLKPRLRSAEAARLHTKMHLCRWEKLEEEITHLTTSVRSGICDPFTLLSLSDSFDDHLCCAQAWVASRYPKASKSIWPGTIYKHSKIRVGYVSADFNRHPIAHLTAELFELHDKTRFELSAYSIGPDDKSDIRQRLINSFDNFVACENRSDAEVAHAIADAEIDILIDLNGFTKGARTNIFAYRPAPIQVNYLGYPGTMQASYIDYIIGDKTIFSFSDGAAYSEKLVSLPHCFQPNDRKRLIADAAFKRQDFELPADRIVFCCFNRSYKILPEMFGCWMRILKGVEGSVLWLSAENETAIANLKKEAQVRGVDPTRLVFARRMEQLPEHLARHRLADLFLDTLPYNAHTTASDALWTGLPVLTKLGNTFAGRVAASLLDAIGLPDLITHSREEYEALAIELALNREKLQAIREKLERNRLTTPLFDTALYTKHLEAAYKAMYQRHQTGLPPDHIDVQSSAITETQ